MWTKVTFKNCRRHSHIRSTGNTLVTERVQFSQHRTAKQLKLLSSRHVSVSLSPTCRLGAVGVLDGQLQLLDEVGPVEGPLLPDVEEALHRPLTAIICFPGGSNTDMFKMSL